jgi:hypothetical protein
MSTNFNKPLNITFIKLRSVVLKLVDGQKDTAKPTGAFIATFRGERAKNVVAVINHNQDQASRRTGDLKQLITMHL